MKKLTLTDNQYSNIINYLDGIPADWQLLPVSGKRGYLPGWQNGIDREIIKSELSGKATGIGLILGEKSGGLVAVDEDGLLAMQTAEQLSNGINPPTYEFTSGREHRRQRIYRIPQEYWEFIQTRRLSCGLEFRWNGTQSVLPYSLHPITHAPYIESCSHNIIETAPNWVISAMMKTEATRPLASPGAVKELDTFWHSQLVQFPARIYSHYGSCLKIWLLAKWYDTEGKGHHKFTLYAASTLLRRKQSTIRAWLREAKQKGLIRYYTYTQDGYIKVYYSALWKVAVGAGLEDLGPVARINLCDVNNLNITATQIEKQHVQRQSEHIARKTECDRLISLGKSPEEAKALSRTIKADQLLTQPCENLERVLCANTSTIFVSENFNTYGANNEKVAETMGIHPVTVSRHLSNSYRTPSPIKGYKAETYLLEKKQILQRCPRKFKNFQGDRKYWEGKGQQPREWERKPSIIQEQYSMAKSRKARKLVSYVAKTVTEVVEVLLKTTILRAFSPFCVCFVRKRDV